VASRAKAIAWAFAEWSDTALVVDVYCRHGMTYMCLGQEDHMQHAGEKPIAITWRLLGAAGRCVCDCCCGGAMRF
jgi:hypothetical protein